MHSFWVWGLLVAAARTSYALDNGIARTPSMGWNPYNAFSCNAVQSQYEAQAQLLVDLGLSALGYDIVSLDCGWQGTNRTSNGTFTWSATAIPNGIPALSGFIHGLGLKFAVYSDGGYFSCDASGGTKHWIGSLGFEAQDAQTFVNWGADYLKYDNCYSVSPTDFVDYSPSFSLTTHYATMRDALKATGKAVVFSMCEWGLQDPARWPGTDFGHSWRMSNDIADSWADVLRIINELVPITGFAGPGGFNDMDLLEVGNSGMTIDEQTSHFAFWAAAKSPLFISTDLSKISSSALSLLKNKGLIAVNQDSLGKSIGFRRRYTNISDVWSGPLSDGSTVAVVINLAGTTSNVTFKLSDVGFSSAHAVDLLSGASLGMISGSLSRTLNAHGSIVLQLSNAVSTPALTFKFYSAAASTNILSNGAATRAVNSSVTVVGELGGPSRGVLTITGIDGGSSGGSKLVSIDYINADWTQSTNVPCANCRFAFLSVNGGAPVGVQMPISGMTWDIVLTGYLVELSGFKSGTSNTITISNPTGQFAPDILRVGVQV
ncbi:glycoside hydrolase family 27 protein [Vararia minispora EC-137]|uniref:Glycoside hydrolase family 27 protein n=1 Tax=Vararia minispora EC-137 TaxID=1314806 RepID=A0ACB8QI13_9AGAM|nr:glycoside hydrolase family 27 protein [Vararia minispora EC-137]